MIGTSFDLAIAIGVFVLMPLIIWGNLHNRQSGVMGHLWRERPWLVRIGMTFLALIWFTTTIELATYLGVLSPELAEASAIVLGIPMLVLSLTILAMAAIVITRYVRSRRSA